jgi:hypothetical protein
MIFMEGSGGEVELQVLKQEAVRKKWRDANRGRMAAVCVDLRQPLSIAEDVDNASSNVKCIGRETKMWTKEEEREKQIKSC